MACAAPVNWSALSSRFGRRTLPRRDIKHPHAKTIVSNRPRRKTTQPWR